jgi:hypoxanthine-DNA glycosylase
MIDKPQGFDSTVHSFEPISNEFSRILILGTMPSVQSRKANFYYSHPRNRFWPILAECFRQQVPQSIEDKMKLLLENGIALWDVLASCEIHGSDDSTIRKPVYNDIATFVSGRPIGKILCNGKKAYGFCLHLNLSVPILYLPSTSPANAAWSMERLTEAWKAELI